MLISVKGHKNFTNWTNWFNKNISNILSSILILGSIEIRACSFNILGNFAPVVNKVFSKSWKKFFWLAENSSPSFDLFNISRKVLAIRKVCWELFNNLSYFLNSFDDIWNVSLGNVTNSVCDFSLKWSCVLKTFLDFWEIIFLKKPEHKSGNEIFDSGNIHLVVSCNNWCNSSSWSHFIFNRKLIISNTKNKLVLKLKIWNIINLFI